MASEAAGGMLLIAAAALAMLIANSAASQTYFGTLEAKLGPLSVLHWINDGLMAIFFLLVGLEIKREMTDGMLASAADRRLPFLAAAAGMAVPAVIYLAVVGVQSPLSRGWAVPAATDIAFALGVLALLGKRVPGSLKVFLTTVAVIDDIGAIAIIALFYSAGLNLPALAAAAATFLVMIVLGRIGVRSLGIFLVLAAGLWAAMLLSGVHATIAGVLAALTIPIDKTPAAPDAPESPLHRLEHAIQPWVAFVILPLFALANAGVALGGMAPSALLAPLPLAVAVALFIGKQAGIFAAVRIGVALGWGSRPMAASWAQVYGVALLCGIGFTMSLFIGALAFPGPAELDQVKIGVLAGSILSALVGFAVLRFSGAGTRQLPSPS